MSRDGHREDYDFAGVERRWQEFWERTNAFRTDDASPRPKFYCLAQFPYPSGSGLHMGHASIYTYTDVIARHKRHQGFEVLHPMGWDAFGLPTENHAIKEGVHPAVITEKNVATFRRQLKALGLSYDWGREVCTSAPDYYRWTQWIWKRLHQAGLTYKTETAVNWCDECRIVVANEEVDPDGTHERCHAPVRRRHMRQWMFRITAYADRLLAGLEGLDWPESSKKAQRDWIGRSEGARVQFRLAGRQETIEVFTTRPDTLFGATYMVLAPEHPLVELLTTAGQRAAVDAYRAAAAGKSEFDRAEMGAGKTGVFTGAYAVNPVNDKEIPIWIADYVLVSYGTGAIMAVPAHDSRDFAFAKAFDLPVRRVLSEPGVDASAPMTAAFEGDGVLIASAGKDLALDGLSKQAAIRATIAWLEKKGLGRGTVNYKLRDWIFARQRYWGEPFPIQYLEDGTPVLLEDEELPLVLPEVESYQPSQTGESPLALIPSWVQAKDRAGRPVRRETDTMPQWAGSCWYYLRFMDPRNEASFASLERQRRWGRVDVYVGGTEHLNLHDLYSRFWHLALKDLGLVHEAEPYQKLLHQGMILGPDGSKMSKSAGNVVNPDLVMQRYGTDVLRLNICFMGPVEANKPWNENGLEAMRKFVQRLWRLVEDPGRVAEGDGAGEALRVLHRTIKAVSRDMEAYRFNTALARLMELLNALQKEERPARGALLKLAVMLSPLAPHFAEEMWTRLGGRAGLGREPWPAWDEALCAAQSVEVAVQVAGKLRLRVQVPAGLSAEEQGKAVLDMPEVRERLGSAQVVKTVSVPGRLVNFITAGGP